MPCDFEFFRELSGRDLGFFPVEWRVMGLFTVSRPLLIPPRVSCGIGGSRNLGFISAIRADSGRFNPECT